MSKFIFGIKLYMFRTVPLSINRSFLLYTYQWCMLYRFADSLRARELSANLYTIYLLLCVQWKTPDDGQRNCPKHIEFYSKNKFEKLVHLVGFIVRIYHDARSYECKIQIRYTYFLVTPQCFVVLWAKSGKPVNSSLGHKPKLLSLICRRMSRMSVGHEVITNFMALWTLRHMKIEKCRLTVEKLFDEQRGGH